MNIIRYFLSCLIISIFFFSSSSAQMPPHPLLLEKIERNEIAVPYTLNNIDLLRKNGIDEPWSSPDIQLKKQGSFTRSFGPASVPSGGWKALGILVQFTDKIAKANSSYFDTLLFGQSTGTLRDYYKSISYNSLDLVTINLPSSLGWITAPQTYSYYVNQQNGMGAYPQNSQKLVEDILPLVDPQVDFSQYDNDKDGYVDALFIIHAGRGAEYFLGTDNDIWSHASATHTKPVYDGVIINRYSIEPEYWSRPGDMTCGVFAHEMGHSVFGLPDLYDVDRTSRGLDRWSLMAMGSWNGHNGSSPALPDAWSHIQMGFIYPKLITKNVLKQLINNVESSPEVYLLCNDLSGKEYFLVENRQKSGYDYYLVGSGLLIYHIDNLVGGNSHEWYPGHTSDGHYKVALEQADGMWHLEQASLWGPEDPYPGTTNKRNFNKTSVPDSKTYDFVQTGIEVVNISNSGPLMTADLIIGTMQQFSDLLYPFPELRIHSASWGDYDNDGDLDLLISGEYYNFAPFTKIFDNNGNNSFSQNTSVSLIGARNGSVDWGDYDNDNYLDLIITGNNAIMNETLPVSKIYHNNRNKTFTEETSIQLTGVSYSSVDWGDYDNDGYLDLIIIGARISGSPISKIYRNDGGKGFIPQSIPLVNLDLGSASWGDYDSDNDLDLVISGYNRSNVYYTKIYRNNNNNIFEEQTTYNLTGVYYSSTAWGDFDNDSDLDLLLIGINNVETISRIYINNGYTFTEKNLSESDAIYSGSAACGDYDNDGNLDILLTGLIGDKVVTKIYHNDGKGNFTEQSSTFIIAGRLGKWGDYDNDGDLDILLGGEKLKLLRNNSVSQNSIPDEPSDLNAAKDLYEITFTWDKSNDKETPQNGLNYNLLIGTSPDNLNILSPMSDRTTGYRRVVRRGNSQTNKWTIRGLPDGDYYWSVQAIDNSFAASPFAPVQHLTVDNKIICNPDMICYWKLDEINSGNYKDVINDLDAASTISPIPVKGIVSGAQQFNGSTTKINVPPNPLIDFSATGSFSVEFWYKGNKIPSTSKCAVGRYIGNPSAKWWVGLNGQDGRATFYLSSGGASAVVKGPSITDGNWHHVVAARNGSTRSIKIYVDGILRASTSKIFLNDFSSPRINLNIGWYNFQDAYALDGALDEIAIYNKELPAAVVEEHYNRSKLGLDYCGDPLSPPVITSTPPTSKLYYGQKFVYDVDATGYPAPTYSLHLYSYLMFIDPVTGLFEWTPLDPGEYQVTVKASNGVLPDALQTFTISVMDTLVCPPQLVSHWKLDEINSNTFSDEMGLNTAYGYNLTPVYEGRSNAGQWFNGSTSKINVPPDPSFDFPANGSFTVEFWYKGDKSPSTSKCAVGRYIGNPPARWWVGLNSLDGRAVFYISSGGSSAVVRGAPIIDGIWHHVAASRNGITKSMKIYVDGVLQDSTFKVFTNNFSSPGANLNVGWYNFQSAYALEGVLDEIAIFNDELPASEIEKHYKRVSYCTRGLLAPPEISASLQADVIPSEYMLYQNFPNPFNPETEIRFSIPEPGRVTIKIYNLLGEEAAELVNDFYETGTYTKHFDASGLSSGVYFYRMESGKYSSIRKLIILK